MAKKENSDGVIIMATKYFMQRIPIEAKPFLERKSIKMTDIVRNITGKQKVPKIPFTKVILALSKSEAFLENDTLRELSKNSRRIKW